MNGVIAELGQTGGDDVGTYVEAVHAFAASGAAAVKVQMIEPARLAHSGAAPYWQTSRYAATQAESFRLAGCVPHDGWGPVREACEEAGIGFVATPFDLGAVDALADLDPWAVKVASGDITFRRLITECAARFDRLIISTGAANDLEVMQALRWAKVARDTSSLDGLLPLACSLEYPCPDDHARLGRIASLAELTRTLVGYSDHTVQTDWGDAYGMGMAVAAAGAVVAEKHVALDLSSGPVPDLDMALTPDRFAEYAAGFAIGTAMAGTPEPFGPADDEQAARVGARRAIWVEALPAGHALTADDLPCLRPCPEGAALPDVEQLVGRALTEDVEAGYVSSWEWNGDGVILRTRQP